MKRKALSKLILLFAVPLIMSGCNNKKEEPITNTDESTIIKNATNTDEYIKKEDYKSLAYAYIYNIRKGLTSYESETNGTVKARVLFFDYNIKYNTITYKRGDAFYSKDDSKSTLLNVTNEFYMVDNEKILVSRDMKKYDVYTLEDYHKISYSPDQYQIMGYVFNDESILKAELVSNTNELVKVKYTMDNNLSTNLVKVDLKCNGGLTSYPEFKNIEITLAMKKDFTPISYSIDARYTASRPVIGSTEVHQEGECLYSNVNGDITITNEDALISLLGAKPSEVVINDEEDQVKTELGKAFTNLDFKNGVNINGAITLSLLPEPSNLNIETHMLFDVTRLSKEKIYNIVNFYGKVSGDDSFNAILSLVKSFAGEQLGEYANLFDSFKSLEIVYDGNGALYLVPTNQTDAHVTVLKFKLVDIVDILLKQINVYNLVTGANDDLLSYKKINGDKEGNYKVELSLNQDKIDSIRLGLSVLLNNEKYALVKMLLGYKDFDSIKMSVDVEDNVFKSFDASFNYVKSGSGSEEDSVKTLIAVHVEAKNQTFDFESQLTAAKELYDTYTSILEPKAKFESVLNNTYVSRAYVSLLEETLKEYQALSDAQKAFLDSNIESRLQDTIKQINDIYAFLDVLYKYDLSKLDNEQILELAKAYHATSLATNLLKGEIGEDKYNVISDLSSLVNYSILDGAISKLEGDDASAWGLTEEEIKGIKLIFDIAEYETSISFDIYLKLLMAGKSISTDDLKAKINELYNNL